MLYDNDDTTVIGNDIISNTASTGAHGDGGGISGYYCETITVTDNDIYSNTASTVDHGIGGGVYFFDSEEIDINGNDISLSICAWVKVETGIDGDSYIYIAAKWDTDDEQYAFYVRGTDTDEYKVRLELHDGTDTALAETDTTNIAVGEWHHFCGVYNDTDIRMYKDGSLDDAAPTAHTDGIRDGAEPFYVGARFSSGSPVNYFDGLIDELIIFDRELSAAEVFGIYKNGIDGTQGAND